MNETTWLMLASVVLAVVLIAALALLAGRIASELEAIGNSESLKSGLGGTSLLAKIAFGVRAIETETSHLGPQATQLNTNLEHVAKGLTDLRDSATALADVVGKQKG
ncbi:MAG: hypothetical protein ABIP94_11965 [Planctomycetota bacterium]